MTRTLVCVLACSVALGGQRPAAASSQKFDEGWGVTRVQPREVSRIRWDLQRTTEVLVRLVPEGPDGKPQLNLVFQAFFPGRALRDPYSGLPQWPKGTPSRLVVIAQAYALAFSIPRFTLTLVADGRTFDLTGPAGRFRLFPCIGSDTCSPNGVEADLDPAVLRTLVAARSIRGEALGVPIELTEADRRALSEFAERIGESKK